MEYKFKKIFTNINTIQLKTLGVIGYNSNLT